MTYWTSAAAQVKALAKAVSTAFAASNLAEDEKSPGRIEITDLAWQAPPLLTPLILSGGALQDYFDVPMPVDQERLHMFWRTTMSDMWYRPTTLLKRGVIANCSAMPAVRVGQRAFRFSRPTGWPVCDETSGVMLSLEVAQAALASLPVKDVVRGGDTYYVEMSDGTRFGVEDGAPLIESPWPATPGMVQDLLAMPRGDAAVLCDYDQIASLRSVLYVHRARFPANFDAIDYALQALRLLAQGQSCPDLLQRMRIAPLDMALARAKERALFDALDTVDAEAITSDRKKLEILLALLVPDVVPMTTFRRNIFAGDQFPFTLARGRLTEIRNWLITQYQQLPVELQKGIYAVRPT